MPVAFIDLAQSCAPSIAIETLAGIVSLESSFDPFAVRTGRGPAVAQVPATKTEAIKIATLRASKHQDARLGLGGIGMTELQNLQLSISSAFDPCLNLQATARLLDGYYRRAVKAGADAERAEQMMLQSYYNRDDPSAGALVKYDEQVRREIKRLGPTLATLTIGWESHGKGPDKAPSLDGVAETTADISTADEATLVPFWNVFASRASSSVLVFSKQSNGDE
jgi:type IV secretion system protein VirB1